MILSGRDLKVILGQESTWNTKASTIGDDIDIQSFSGWHRRPKAPTPVTRSRSPIDFDRDPRRNEFQLSALMRYEGLELPMYHLLGKQASATESAVKRWTISKDDSVGLPAGLTLEAIPGSIIAAGAKFFTGCKVDTGEFAFEPGGKVRANFGIIGGDVEEGSADTFVAPSSPLVDWTQLAIQYDSGGGLTTKKLRSLNIRYSNGYAGDLAVLGSSLIEEPVPGDARLEVTAEAYAEDEVWEDLHNAETEVKIVATATSSVNVPGSSPAAPYDMIFTLYHLILDPYELPVSDGSAVIQQLSFQGRQSTSELMDWKVLNARTTVP